MSKTITLNENTTNVEPIEILTRIIDAMVAPATKTEMKLLAKYGLMSNDEKANTHFEHVESSDTVVKFKINGKVMWFKVDSSAYEVSLYDDTKFVSEVYKEVEAEEDVDMY